MGKQKFNPYDELGVPPDAEPDDIKKAYRDRSKATHHDHDGGSQERFALVKLAKDVLCDDKRRAKFDATGDIDESKPDNTHVEAFEIVMGVINSIIDGEHATDPLAQNLVVTVSTFLGMKIQECSGAKVSLEKKVKRNDRALKKFRRKTKGPNMIANALTLRSNNFRAQIETIDLMITRYQKAIALVQEYEFAPEPETLWTLVKICTLCGGLGVFIYGLAAILKRI